MEIGSPLIALFGLGAQEILLILVALVFLFGAKKIPEIARGLGKGMSEFKRGMKDGQDDSGTSANEKENSKTP